MTLKPSFWTKTKNHSWVQKLVIFDNSEVLNSHWESGWKKAKKETNLLGKAQQTKLRFLSFFFIFSFLFLFFFFVALRNTILFFGSQILSIWIACSMSKTPTLKKLEVKVWDYCQTFSGKYNTYSCSYSPWVKIIHIMEKRELPFENERSYLRELLLFQDL